MRRCIAYLLSPNLQCTFNRTGRADPRGNTEQKIGFKTHLEPLIKSKPKFDVLVFNFNNFYLSISGMYTILTTLAISVKF